MHSWHSASSVVGSYPIWDNTVCDLQTVVMWLGLLYVTTQHDTGCIKKSKVILTSKMWFY